MRLSCGGELLLSLLLVFTLFTNASLMTSYTLPSHPNGCKWSMCCLQFAHWLQNDVHNLQKLDLLWCCYVTYDNFATCLLCNHNCFTLSEISNIDLLDLFPSTTTIAPTTFNEISFSLAEPHVPNDYLTLSEINSVNSTFCNKLSYFHFNVRSLANNKHKIDTFFSMCNVSLDFIAISEIKVLYKYTNS